MRITFLCLLSTLVAACAQGAAAVPTFQITAGQGSYTLAGRDPAQGDVTTIPTVLVPITLTFDARKVAGEPVVMDAVPEVASVLRSPIFSKFDFPSGGVTQYADAMLRTTFPKVSGWHTLLGEPEVTHIRISIPVGYGYVLTSKRTGGSLGIVDIEFLQKELFKQIPKQQGKLVIAMTRNTAYYALGDATVCCSWGTHGVDSVTGNSFVLGSYVHAAPAIVEDADVQPLTQQLAEFFNDPLHDPLARGRNVKSPGNTFSAWMRPGWMAPEDEGRCGGTGVGSTYFLLEPTDTNPKNNIPVSKPFVARAHAVIYHLQNVALLPWYTGPSEGLGTAYSFPDARVLPEPSTPCPPHRGRTAAGGAPPAPPRPMTPPIPMSSSPNGHWLIGYWTGYGSALPARNISTQWDVIIVAFATPDKNAPEGTLRFQMPAGLDPQQFKDDIAWLQSQGKKVLISLGGGGQYFSLADSKNVPNFVSSVTRIVSDYGFDGIDLDFESPSLVVAPGDTDFKHPTTPSIVNLIAGLRQLHDHFGSRFMISLVPEGTQIPGGYPGYGGQFGSYLPIAYAIRDMLSFVDVQDYNTPPLQGLDGEIYQAGSVDYHAAMTELLLHGFPASGEFFPPMPANKVAVGFLAGDTTPAIVSQAMNYLITGEVPAGTRYKLHERHGYPGMIGAMFWTLDADGRGNYNFSNVVGPQLHKYPAAR